MSPLPARQTAPHRLLGLPGLLVAGFLAALGAIVVAGPPAPDATREPGAGQEKTTYRPGLAVPDTMAPFLEHVEPGTDAFPLEGQARELEARLRDVSDGFRGGAARLSGVTRTLIDPGFRGGRLLPAQEAAPGQSQLEVTRAKDLSGDPTLDARAFTAELQRLIADVREVAVAEFLITSIQPDEGGDSSSRLRTSIRYDIVGAGTKAYRVQHVGEWQMIWRRNAAGWQIFRWTAASHVVSRARTPIFTEITEASLGGTDSFRRQLAIDLDSWMATFDSVLTRDSNGHHGVSVGDVDGDGLEDLYVAQPAGLPNRLYRNRGDSTFEDITDKSGLGVLDDTAASLFVDVDNDGDEDLVLSTATKPILFLNDGSGHFTAVEDGFRFAKPLQGVLTSISMADYDRDGYVDMYLCVYSYFFGAGEDKAGTPAPYYDARNGPPGVLLRNDGHGHFVDATADAGLEAGNDRYHFAAAWADYDGDGWPDLLVSNDFGTKNLYRNLGLKDGKVRFEDVAASAGVLDHGAGMSATFFDYDNDGLLDIYTGNMWSAPGQRVTSAPTFMPDATPDVRALYRRHVRGNSLLRNLGNGRFEDKSIEAHAEMGRWAWSSDAFDFDRDGWEDLYVVNGMLSRGSANARGDGAGGAVPDDLEGFFWRQVVAHSPLTRVPGTRYDDAWRAINQLLIHGSIASRQRNVFLRNDGHGSFDDVSGAIGLDLDQDGRSFALLDVDGDGDQDLVVMAARQAPQLRIFRNDFESSSRSLAVRLTGSKSNRDAIGARVTVQTDRMRRTKIVQAGSGFLSEHSRELIIGLGASERVTSLTVDWPSGGKQNFTEVPLNVRVRIVEGGTVKTEPFATRPASQPAPESPQGNAASPPDATWLYEPFPAPEFTLKDLSGRMHSLSGSRGKPSVLLLFSTEVAAARTALATLQRGASALAQAGIGSIAVAIDGPRDPSALGVASSGAVPVLASTPEVSLSYAILNRHIFMNRQDLRLPTCLLLDAGGNVVKIYRDRLDVAQVVADAATIDATPAETAQPCGAVSRDVLLAAAAAQLPSVRAGAARPGPRVCCGHRLRASRTGEPGRLDALSPGHAAGEERRDGSRAGCARARAGAATRPRRGQQRSRSAARAGRRPRWGDRPLPGSARGHARLPRRAEQPRLRSAAHGPRCGGPCALREGPGTAARLPRGAEQPRTAPGPGRRHGTGRALLPRGAEPARRLWGGRQQPGARARLTRAGGCGGQPARRISEADSRLRVGVRHARQDPLQRRAAARSRRGARAARPAKSEECRGIGTAQSVEEFVISA